MHLHATYMPSALAISQPLQPACRRPKQRPTRTACSPTNAAITSHCHAPHHADANQPGRYGIIFVQRPEDGIGAPDVFAAVALLTRVNTIPTATCQLHKLML